MSSAAQIAEVKYFFILYEDAMEMHEYFLQNEAYAAMVANIQYDTDWVIDGHQFSPDDELDTYIISVSTLGVDGVRSATEPHEQTWHEHFGANRIDISPRENTPAIYILNNMYHPKVVEAVLYYVYTLSLRKGLKCDIIGSRKGRRCALWVPLNDSKAIQAWERAYTYRQRDFHREFPSLPDLMKKKQTARSRRYKRKRTERLAAVLKKEANELNISRSGWGYTIIPQKLIIMRIASAIRDAYATAEEMTNIDELGEHTVTIKLTEEDKEQIKRSFEEYLDEEILEQLLAITKDEDIRAMMDGFFHLPEEAQSGAATSRVPTLADLPPLPSDSIDDSDNELWDPSAAGGESKNGESAPGPTPLYRISQVKLRL